MSGFIYNGKSTKDIISSSELVLCSTDGGFRNAIGVEREILGGEPSISRPVVNEYGIVANHLEFRYSLMKANGDDFTTEEQRTVEKWLTSKKFSSPLQLFDCNDVVKCKYFGNFTLTSWDVAPFGFSAANFIFSVNGSYAFEHYTHTFRASDLSNYWSFSINCQTDEYEEYVYPVIKISQYDSSHGLSMTLINSTDNNNQFVITTTLTSDIYIDCLHNILRSESGIIPFSSLGWDDVGNIYWPRLEYGVNTFRCKGAVELTFDYDCPLKYVGGWLV